MNSLILPSWISLPRHSSRRIGSRASVFLRAFSSSVIIKKEDNHQNGLTLGILRETYDPWERRVPLCPRHVEKLLSSSLNQVLIQPSTRRIYTHDEYHQAGAILQEDLSSADLIIGVKRPQHHDSLIPNKTYLFFAHVLKGQPENMPLLQYVVEHKIQLLDYEGIINPKTGKRLVAFGQFAGRAGMTDALQVVGRRLLDLGYSTPFLNCPPAHMHHDWQQVCTSLASVGQHIQGEGLPLPLVFCLTGKGGNVYSGAKQVLELLPHKMVRPEDLPLLYRQSQEKPHHVVYGVSLGPEHVFRPKQGKGKYDKQDYRANPTSYESVFAQEIAPYISVLVNGFYWDERYPRLINKKEMRKLWEEGHKGLLVVADISCDVNGSIEFLERTTTIDHPCFSYDPLLESEVSDVGGDSEVVTVMGVDILPTELPRESSAYFGDALLPVLEEYIQNCSRQDGTNKLNVNALPKELKSACITFDGSLTPSFQHLEPFMNRSSTSSLATGDVVVLWMEGHIFDSGLINQVLDAIENTNCNFEIIECHARRKEDGVPRKSSLMLRIAASSENDLAQVQEKIDKLVNAIESAEASVKYIDHHDESTPSGEQRSKVTVTDLPNKEKVLLLGAGRVSKSLARYLGRDLRRTVVVVGDDENEACSVADEAADGRHVVLNVCEEPHRLSGLVRNADIVVSLLPATMHVDVARICISESVNLVTASYERSEMQALDESAKQAGISILNEVGLDPGLDHMSAMKIIDDIHKRDGVVTSFSSVCGGIPSPEAANNPLKYKFSWSPMGVLIASQNSATYRWEGETIHVDGRDLLKSAVPFDEAWASLDLECLPNRDSLIYGDLYGIQDADTIFRGTLRYGGFSSLMEIFRTMGLLESSTGGEATWNAALQTCQANTGSFENFGDFVLHCAGGDAHMADKALELLELLDMKNDAPLSNPDSMIQSFCDTLEKNCRYVEHEHDMVLMHHDIQASFADSTHEHHRSRLQALGDADGSAMSRTVGYTAAAAAELLLQKTPILSPGCLRPTSEAIYTPILDAVAKEGIQFSETITRSDDELSFVSNLD